MCLTALKKVAVILLAAVILIYIGICENFPNGFIIIFAPHRRSFKSKQGKNECSEHNQYNVHWKGSFMYEKKKVFKIDELQKLCLSIFMS